MSDIPSRKTSVSERKRLDLREKGMHPVGWIYIQPETGRRATLDHWGRLQWWDVDGSGKMDYDAIEKMLWGLGGQLTCESQSDVLTAFRQLRARVAELESENNRLRQQLIGQIQSDAQDMGLYGGSE